VIARDIYRGFYEDPGPTIEEKLALAGKRIGILLAGCALVLGVLDIAGVHSITGASQAVHTAPASIAGLGERLRHMSFGSSQESVRVAIPERSPIRVSIAKAPKVIDDLVAMRSQDAVSMAMLSPQQAAPGLREMKLAAPALVIEARPPAVTPSISEIAARSLASVPAADQIQPASLSLPAVTSSPFFVTTPDAIAPGAAPAAVAPPSPLLAPVTIPLSQVPLPRAAPPMSPADRLGLKDKEYARAERCLANAIYFEARSEPLRGQMAVAQVVVNRAFSGFYPNDICGVVYQNASRHLACQFTFACDGKRKLITERGHWAVANRIARQTLDGQIYVPEVAKSTHYHAAYVHPSWTHEMKRLVRFGVHSFYRPYAWGNGNEEPVWGSTAVRVQKTAAR
jgi:hypothetical protein